MAREDSLRGPPGQSWETGLEVEVSRVGEPGGVIWHLGLCCTGWKGWSWGVQPRVPLSWAELGREELRRYSLQALAPAGN